MVFCQLISRSKQYEIVVGQTSKSRKQETLMKLDNFTLKDG